MESRLARQAKPEGLLQRADRLRVVAPYLIEEREPLARLRGFPVKGEINRIMREEIRGVAQERPGRQVQNPFEQAMISGRKVENLIQPYRRRDIFVEMRCCTQRIENIGDHCGVRLYTPSMASSVEGLALAQKRV